MVRKEKILIFIVVIGIVFTVIGSTLAYWNWSTTEAEKTNVVFTITNNFSCAADGGGNITSSDLTLIPTTVSTSTSNNYIKREVKVKPNLKIPGVNVYMDLWLDIKDIGSGLSNSDNFRYAFTTSSNSPTECVVSSGNFKGKVVGDKVNLLYGKGYTQTIVDTYYLWIWLDAEETSSTTMNQTFSLSLNGSCSDQPYQSVTKNNMTIDVPSGLIPIKYEGASTVKTVSATDSTWGDYDNKEWANAVLVKESGTNTREYYQNNIGVEIPEDDILAYYVYVPRYKYKIWTTELSAKGKEQEIDIVFENKNIPKSNGSSVGEYLTHPAFTFGDTELNGIWFGKFELTGTASEPTIKPSVLSLRNQTISTAFTTIKKIENGYGLGSNVDSHMTKNSEWGAAAYLSQSKYGRCTNGSCEEIRRNNNSGYYTGYSAVNVATTGWSETSSSTNQFGTSGDITQPYNTEVGYKASTTGNIYGIYDMSGGAWERVMGVLADPSGNPRSGNTTSNNSGYNGMLADGSMYTSGINFPDSKYYDIYTSTNTSSYASSLTLTACNGGPCLGHSLSEIAGWNNDYAAFVYAAAPWFGRGGRFDDGFNVGPFYFGHTDRNAYSTFGSRAVLCVINS